MEYAVLFNVKQAIENQFEAILVEINWRCACKAQRFLAIALPYAQQLIILLDRAWI